MKSKSIILAGCLILWLSGGNWAKAGPDSRKSLQVVVNSDSIVVSVENEKGQGNSVTLPKQALSENSDSTGFMIRDELYIDNDKIIIDGNEFTTADIQNLMISRNDERTMTFRATLPNNYNSPADSKRIIKIDRASDKDRVGFSGLVVAKEEIIHGDVVALAGDVKVFGKVYGDIVSVFGNIHMYDGSYAGGDVVAPFGQVIATGDSRIKGSETSACCPAKRSKVNIEASARFNRVEGFTPLLNLKYRDTDRELPDIDFGIGYGFALKQWNIDFGFKQNIGIDGPFYFGGKLYRGAYTPDQGNFTQTENTVAGLFFKEDYHDFYMRKGGQIFGGREFWKKGFAQIEFTAQTNSPLGRHVKSAIFGGHKKFRENYSSILPDSAIINGLKGDLHLIGLHLGWDSRKPEHSYRGGQYLDLSLATAGKSALGKLGGDFTYDIVEADIQQNQPVTGRQFLNFHIRAGLSNQKLPLDRWFFLGGVGTLRGYDFKEFAGNRFLLANVDYYWDFSDDFSMALFTDLGQCGFSQSQFQKTGLKSDMGLGLILGEAIRLDIAQRLDDTGKSPIITARIVESF
jgi:hypothetical protein